MGVIALRGWVKRRLMKLLDDLVGMLGWCVDGGRRAHLPHAFDKNNHKLGPEASIYKGHSCK